jgi:regulator of cell morphogenesis and NO signaling
MQGAQTMTVGDIVAHDVRTASVFARHGIDFCCGGRTPFDEACRARGLDPAALVAELDAVERQPDGAADLTRLPLDAMIQRVVSRHHAFVRAETPVIKGYLTKLAAKHGPRHPELCRLADIFDTVSTELTHHMYKEEAILFPYINAMVRADRAQQPLPQTPFGTIRNPIRMMEAEHEDAAGALGAMRIATTNYTPPREACTTWAACYAALEAFEQDLHEHVHLENNVLFPAALRLENELGSWVAG